MKIMIASDIHGSAFYCRKLLNAFHAENDEDDTKGYIYVADGTFTLNAGTDALHAENDEDDTLGWVYIAGGSFAIASGDDGRCCQPASWQ